MLIILQLVADLVTIAVQFLKELHKGSFLKTFGQKMTITESQFNKCIDYQNFKIHTIV